MRVTVVGAGNAGICHSYMFARQGHEVTLFKTSTSMHEENFNHILRTKTIRGNDPREPGREFEIKLSHVTRSAREAIPEADVIFVTVQTQFHEDVARVIGPFLKPGQIVLAVPGYLGSLVFRRYAATPSQIVFAEGESTPYDSRIAGPGQIRLIFANVRNAVAFLPHEGIEQSFAKLQELVPTYTHLRENVLESSLHNPNLIVHTIGVIMSAGRIEYSKGEFCMYREAFTPSIWKLIAALDIEKNAVLKSFGLRPLPYLEACKFRNEPEESIEAKRVFESYATLSDMGPSSIDHRYVTEDVPMGLGLLSTLGRLVGVPTPVCDSLIHIGSALLGRDFFAETRTLDSLGWENLSLAEIRHVLDGDMPRAVLQRRKW